MVQLTQDTLIEALRLLRKAHPELPLIDWRISQYAHELQGDSDHRYTRETFEAYAKALGGEITQGSRFTYAPNGVPTEMQTYRLRLTWADVPIVIHGSVPAAELAVSA